MKRALDRVLAGTLLILAFLAARPALAIDFFDGRFEVNGYYELQLRGIGRDLGVSDEWDLTQFAHVLNIEAEASLVEWGWGPFDIVNAYTRVEVRYDCVWTQACGMFPSAHAFGNNPTKLPKRLNSGRRTGQVWNAFDEDTRYYRGEEPELFSIRYRDMPPGSRRPYNLDSAPAFGLFFKSPGVDNIVGTDDDPAPFVFSRYFEGRGGKCQISSRQVDGPTNGSITQILGFVDPDCDIKSLAAIHDKPNPFRSGDFNPITGVGGAYPLPFRPAPPTGYMEDAPEWVAKGNWIPRAELARRLRNDNFDALDDELNFSKSELAWNHGSSQEYSNELKEAYLDIEMFDTRLWLRLGKQTIVWGKTELFRSQDQFNPQDLALSTLPAFEESRVPLWALRGVWSFFDIGPFQDVRLEVAANFDQYKPNDLGVCGEPYSLALICVLSFATAINGFEGIGIAGERRPSNPWDSLDGIEVGGRLEWRWEQFSFALTDFWGYDDNFYLEKVLTFERNVDPETGRPRRLSTRGGCKSGNEPDCLRPGNDALYNTSSNRTMFDVSCAGVMGMSIDPAACGLSVFNSQNFPPEAPPTITLAESLATLLAGNRFIVWPAIAFPSFSLTDPRILNALVALNRDANDGPVADNFFGLIGGDLSGNLTDEQEALLGCGRFWGTSCDFDGMDLFNTEASAISMAFVGFDGTFGVDWDTTDASLAQPGTIGFDGGPVCTRYERGQTFILPGCRGPGDSGYNLNIDGTPPNTLANASTGLTGHPFTGQKWASEMSALSWNFMALFVALSAPPNGGPAALDEFDENQPLRKDACSFAKPQLCNAFSFFLNPIGVRRNIVQAGGNERFGRRDFLWHSGNPVILRYKKRNVLGFSTDFTEDTTRTNWGIEFTWLNDLPFSDGDEHDGLRDADTFNLTVSIDRPTFINFLNANRTFFINTQWFFQYISGYRDSFRTQGPFNVLGTLTVQTGYFQDRLLAGMTMVYDIGSSSGAFLPQFTYRFSGRFSASVGISVFFGDTRQVDMATNEIAIVNRVGPDAYMDSIEDGLSILRDRDEAFLRIRYTF
jgi:hypothetical protein